VVGDAGSDKVLIDVHLRGEYTLDAHRRGMHCASAWHTLVSPARLGMLLKTTPMYLPSPRPAALIKIRRQLTADYGAVCCRCVVVEL
jgi:hypothetical protein